MLYCCLLSSFSSLFLSLFFCPLFFFLPPFLSFTFPLSVLSLVFDSISTVFLYLFSPLSYHHFCSSLFFIIFPFELSNSDNVNKTSLFEKLDFYRNSLEISRRVAVSGYLHAMKYHRAANLMDYVFRVSPSLHFSLYLSASLCVCLHLFVFVSVCLSVYRRTFSVYLCLCVCLSICLSIYLCVCVCVYVSIYLSLCVPVCVSVCVYLCVCACVCFCLCLSVCVYLSVCVRVSVCVRSFQSILPSFHIYFHSFLLLICIILHASSDYSFEARTIAA